MKSIFDLLKIKILKKPVTGLMMSVFAMLAIIIVLSSCSKSKDTFNRTCEVSFVLNQTNAAGDTVKVKAISGALIQNAPVPVRSGYVFGGWYANSADANPDPTKNAAPSKFPAYDIATKPIYLDAILYARWTK